MSRGRERRYRRAAGWFLLPNLLGFAAFTAWPLLASLLLAFCSWDLLTPPHWIGLGNFTQLLGFHREAGAWVANDPHFWQYLPLRRRRHSFGCRRIRILQSRHHEGRQRHHL